MTDVIKNFAVAGNTVTWAPFGEGHINSTYIFTCDTGVSYILQKISRAAFKKPEELMSNISKVCAMLEEKFTDHRASMHLVPAADGKSFYVDPEGEYWRVYEFVAGSICLQKVSRPEELYKTGHAFGSFQRALTDFPVDELYETIPNFHNTPDRYRLFHEAIERDACGRASDCREEIEFALAREKEAASIVAAMAAGEIPTRVTHNDTKLNNILLDYETREPLCVIDLDTVMPGSTLYDFGDLIRFGASTAAEDERDLSRVQLSEELFEMAAKGYLDGCAGILTEKEIEMLPLGAKLMTLECGTRFLTDHLNGDTYFKIHREGQNLDRCRTQFKLVREMEEKEEKLAEIIKKCAE